MESTEETIISSLKQAAERADDRLGLTILIAESGKCTTPGQRWNRCQRGAAALSAQGVNKGDRVGIILPTCIEFMDAYFGCQLLGAVPVPMYPPVRMGRLDEYFERSAAMLSTIDAVAVISDPRVSKVLGQLINKVRPPLGLIDVARLSVSRARSIFLATFRRSGNGSVLKWHHQSSKGSGAHAPPDSCQCRCHCRLIPAPEDNDGFASGCSWLPCTTTWA